METCAGSFWAFSAPFCAERSSVCVGKNPFRHAATIMVAGVIVVACVLAAVAFAAGFGSGRSASRPPSSPSSPRLWSRRWPSYYVPARSSASWCREVELCDCLVRNSKMQPPQAAAIAMAASSQR